MPFVALSDLKSVRLDYIIVGGRTAGLTLAARLTENPSISALVIEAGSYHGSVPEIDIPGMIGGIIANPKYDWSFRSPRGKGLGGSSLINFLGMFHPSKSECDALKELGNEGWDWESLLYYMKKMSETTIPTNELSDAQAKFYAAVRVPDPECHGTDGPILKSMPREWTDAHARLFEAAEALGIPRNSETVMYSSDWTGYGTNIGSMSAFSSVDPRTATRSYAVTAYLQPNIQRNNFLVLTEAQVTKVILEPDKNSFQRAVGVEIIKDGTHSLISGVQRDVILSAGSLQTPHILELSGIGNSEILAQYNTRSIIHLPGVGENLQDHISVATIVEIENDDETFDVMRDPAFVKKHEELYKQQRGHLAYGPVPAFIFISAQQLGTPESIISWESYARARLTQSLANAIPSLKAGLEKQYKFQEKFIEDAGQAQAEILQYLGHPKVPNSTPIAGKKYTRLSYPLVPLAIDPNYFSNEADLDLLVHIVRFALRLYSTPPLSDIVKSHVLPPADALKDEAGLREYVKDYFGPVYHPVGTASMLSREDGGVVDSKLKVYGTRNLRVVDLSILPLELSCHTQSVAYPIGEKAADMPKSGFLEG